MAEEPVAAPPAEPGTPAAPVALADADGNLREGWLESVDEDLREESYLKEAKTVQGLAKGTVHARRMVGKDKMVIPTAESGDEVWDAYHKIGGRPDTAEDYGFKRPDDFPEEHWDDEFMTKAQEILFRGGASQKLANELLVLNIESVQAALKAQQQQEEFELGKINDALDTEWGLARDQKMHLGNIAVVEGAKGKDGIVNEEYKARLVEKINKDPDLIRFASNLGSKFSEHGVITDTSIPTPGDLDSKIKEEMAKDSYTNIKHPNHDNQVQLVQRLFQDKVKATKTG